MNQSPYEHNLQRVINHYDLGELRSAQRLECGFVNENWVLETTSGRYFLKRRHPDLRNPSIICAQHALIQHLRQAGFPVPAIQHVVSGETFLVLDGEFYEIQQYIEGAPYEHANSVHFQAAAALLGYYHACIQAFAPQQLCELSDLYNPAILTKTLTNLREAWELDQDPALTRTWLQLEALAAALATLFAEHDQLPCLIIHGDYHAGNLLFEGDRIVGLVDYDKACWQPRVVELAEALIYFASPHPGHMKHLVYPGFLEWDKFTSFLWYYSWKGCSKQMEPVGLVEFPELDLARDEADSVPFTFLKDNEVHALPDYICCIWVSVSLQRLLEKGSRPAVALDALQEVLELGEWGTQNRTRIIETTYKVLKRTSALVEM